MPLVYNPASKSYEVWEQPMSGSVSYINPRQPATVVNPQSLQPVTYDKTNIPIEVTPQLEAANAPVVGYVSGEKGQEKSYALKTPLSQEQFNMQFNQPPQGVQQESLPKQGEVVSLPDAISVATQASQKTFETGIVLPAVGSLTYGAKVGEVNLTPFDYSQTYNRWSEQGKIQVGPIEIFPLKAGIVATHPITTLMTGATAIGATIGTGKYVMQNIGTPVMESLTKSAIEKPTEFTIGGIIESGALFAPLMMPEITGVGVSSRIPIISKVLTTPGVAQTLIGGGIGGISAYYTFGAKDEQGKTLFERAKESPLSQVQFATGIFGMSAGAIEAGKGIQTTWEYFHPSYEVTFLRNIPAERIGYTEISKEKYPEPKILETAMKEGKGYIEIPTKDIRNLKEATDIDYFQSFRTEEGYTGTAIRGKSLQLDTFTQITKNPPEIPEFTTFKAEMVRSYFKSGGENLVGFGEYSRLNLKPVKIMEPTAPDMGGVMQDLSLGTTSSGIAKEYIFSAPALRIEPILPATTFSFPTIGFSSLGTKTSTSSIFQTPIAITQAYKQKEREVIFTPTSIFTGIKEDTGIFTTPIQITPQKQPQEQKTSLLQLPKITTANMPKPVTETITRITPPPIVPFNFDLGGGNTPRLSKIFTNISRSYKYTPSLVGMYRGERISRTPRGTLTGLEIRPVVGPKPKKRSALDVMNALPSVTKLKLGKNRATKLRIKL